MNNHLPQVRHLLCALFFLLSPSVTPLFAGIIRIEITERQSPAFGGKAFGKTGAYEKLAGKAYAEADPRRPENRGITDIRLAPRNARGMVEYSMDFYLLKPIDLQKGNHKLFAEIPNRGGKLFGPFNKSQGGNDPGAAEQQDGFLMQMGYSVVWCGWDISATPANHGLTLTVPIARQPDGSAITGPSYEFISFDNDKSTRYALTYPAASPDQRQAVLTTRLLLNDVPDTIPATGWTYNNDRSISLLPAGTPFRQSAIYEFTYTAKDPLVAGLGLAATRDLVSFLRYAKNNAQPVNPLAGDVKTTYSFAVSQPARYMNDFQTLGFNTDEQGRPVFDGIEDWLGGGSGVGINYRFAQPGRTERNRQNHLYPEAVFPFAYPVMSDPISGRTGGRLSGYRHGTAPPKVMEINSANEYWVKAASLLHTDPQGNDLPDPPNIRFYLVSGMQHGSGSGAGICQQPQNPTRPEPLLRALFIDLDEWVTRGIVPPASRVPRRKENNAAAALPVPGRLTGVVGREALGWPAIPGVTYTGLITIHQAFDYGNRFKEGVISRYPAMTDRFAPYTCFVSRVDSDGNEIAGVRLPPVAAPVATLTGWALRREGFGLNDGGESAGQCIPFPQTKQDRLTAGDPRLSLEERYGTHARYVAAVTASAESLQQQRFLLTEDVQEYTREAAASKVLQ